MAVLNKTDMVRVNIPRLCMLLEIITSRICPFLREHKGSLSLLLLRLSVYIFKQPLIMLLKSTHR